MRLITILLSCVLLVSCFSSKEVRKKKRAAKLIEKAVRLVPSISQKDTIAVRDTVTVEAVRSDTVFHIDTDSFLIENERLVIRYRKINDSIYIEGECKEEVVTIEKLIPVEKIVYPELEWWERFQWWWIIILVAIYIILRMLKIVQGRAPR